MSPRQGPRDLSRHEWVGRYRKSGDSYAIFIPLQLRQILGWRPGDYLAVIESEGRIMIKRVEASMIVSKEHGPAGMKVADGG